MSTEKKYRMIISGGGTGGHIYPAIAIANTLKNRLDDIEILFVGAKGKMEMEKVPEAGYKIIGLWISGLQRSLTLKNLSFPFKVISSLIKSRKIIREFKPQIAIGVGGYASGPLMYAASRMNIPVLIQEQNSYAGITNKLLAKRAHKICVAYDGMKRFFPESKIVKTGNPVRAEITSANINREEGLAHFDLGQDKKTILVIGGSLGARTLNEVFKSEYKKVMDAGYNLIWQTGKYYYNDLKNLGDEYSGQLKILPFINKMQYAYQSADVIISRAGALAVSELSIVGKPVVLVPSPNVAEDHQTKNAQALVQSEAAIMIKDSEAKGILIEQAIYILGQKELQENLSKNISALAINDAADRIVNEITGLINVPN